MKILLVHNYYREPGGEEEYVESLKDLLQTKGHSVRLFSKSNKVLDRGFEKLKTSFAMFWNPKLYNNFSAVLGSYKPDVVHFNNIFPLITPTAYWACKKLRIPIVQTVHNFRYMFPKSLLFRRGELCPYCLNKRFVYPAFLHSCYNQSLAYTFFFSLSHAFHYLLGSFNLVNKFIFPSSFARNYYIRNSKIAKENTEVINNFAEPGKKAVSKSSYFLYVGRISQEKGIHELLQVFSRLPKSNLVVVGGGADEQEVGFYKKFPNIRFLGLLPKNEVYERLSNALFTIIPSKCLEVAPTVLLESFANSTAVLTPKRGVFKELVDEGKTGFFFLTFNDLGKKIEQMQESHDLAKKLGAKAFKRYNENYRPERHYKKLVDIYERLTDEKS